MDAETTAAVVWSVIWVVATIATPVAANIAGVALAAAFESIFPILTGWLVALALIVFCGIQAVIQILNTIPLFI